MRSLPGGHTPESLSALEGQFPQLSVLPLFRYSCYKSLLQKVLSVVFLVLFGGHTVVLRAYQSSERRELYGKRDQIWVSCSRGQQPTLCTVSLALPI